MISRAEKVLLTLILMTGFLFAGCEKRETQQVDNIELARFYMNNGTYSLSINILRQEASSHPLEASKMLAQIFYDLEYFNEAEKQVSASIQSGCDQEVCHQLLFDTLLELGKYDDAQALLRTSLSGTDSQTLEINKSRLRYRQNNSIEELRASLKSIKSSKLQELLIESMYERKQYAEIFDSWEAEKEYSDDELLVFAKTMYILEDYELAEKILTRLRLQDKIDVINRRKIEAIELLVRVNVALGDFSGADIIYKAFVENYKDSGYVIFNTAIKDIQSANYDKAIGNIEKMVKANPTNLQSSLVLGLAYYGKQEYSRVVLLLSPFEKDLNEKSQVLLASAYQKSGRPQQAIDLLKGTDTNSVARIILSSAYLDMGDRDKARSLLSSFTPGSDSPQLLHEYASLLVRMGMDEQLLDFFSKQNNITRETKKLLVGAMLRQDDEESAKQLINQVSDKSLKLELQGYIEARKGNTKRAIQYYEQASKVNTSKLIVTQLAYLYANNKQFSNSLGAAKKAFYLEGDNGRLFALIRRLLTIDEFEIHGSWLEEVPSHHQDYLDVQLILAWLEINNGDEAAVRSRLDKLTAWRSDSRVRILESLINGGAGSSDSVALVMESLRNDFSLQKAGLLSIYFSRKKDLLNLGKVIDLIYTHEGLSIHSAPLLAKGDIALGKLDRASRAIDYLKSNGKPIQSDDLLADLYRVQKKINEALSLYRKNAELSGSEKLMLKYLNFAFAAEPGRKEALMARAESWLLENDTHYTVRQLLATRYIGVDNEASVRHFEILLGKAPDNVTILNNYAWVLLERNLSLALSLSGKAHRLAPNNLDVADTYLVALNKSGKRAEAMALLDELLAQNPDNSMLLQRKQEF